MVNIKAEIFIEKPILEVFEYISDPNNAIDWLKNTISIQWKTPKPVQLNSKIAVKTNYFGKEMFYMYEVVFIEEGKKIMMKTKEGFLPMMTTYHCIDVDENTTLVKIDVKGNPTGFLKYFSLIINMVMKNSYKKSLLKLKKIVEN
jgi:uncharacterized membrane protein